MGKFIFWLVVAFAVLLGVRLLGAAKRRRNAPNAARDNERSGPKPATDRMVRCERCGVHLPSSDAVRTATGFRCADGRCGAAA